MKQLALKSVPILKEFSDYDHAESSLQPISFFYENKSSTNFLKIRELLETNGLTDKTENNKLKLLLKMLKWTSNYLNFSGIPLSDKRYDNEDCISTVERAKQEGYMLNCRYKSVIFTQFLLASGFQARWVSCLPIDNICKERHCITEVYMPTLKKWIAVDATFNLVYFDKKGNLLNLLEMRRHIIEGNRFRFFTKTLQLNDYIYYCWCCHIFRFQYLLENKYSMLSKNNNVMLYLNPSGYKIANGAYQNRHGKIINYHNEKLFYSNVI